MRGFHYLENVTTLKLDQAACIGCGRCLEVCPHQVFSLTERKASLQDLDACMECGACALNCPVKAIRVESGVGCASGMINEWLRDHNLAKVGGSGCCS